MKNDILLHEFKALHPNLIDKLIIKENKDKVTTELKFSNPRYTLWFQEEDEGKYIVGDKDFNLKEALNRIDDILNNKIVVIGYKDLEQDYIIATMGKESGLKKYLAQKPTVEIVSFSAEY